MASNTTILGAGIIGLSTAYYLAKHQPPGTIHLVEPSPELFASASGNAAGFLARDWYGPGSAALGALSFDEHRRLAGRHDGAARWGYQPSTAVSYTAGSGSVSGGGAGGEGARGEDWLLAGTSRANAAAAAGAGGIEDGGGMAPPWLRRGKGDSVSIIGDSSSTAQVDPLRLCRFLLDECVAQGVHLHHPAVAVSVMADMRNELSSIRVADTASSTETDVPCTRLIIAAGAWSARVFAELFPASDGRLPITSLAGHSLVVKSPRWAAGMERGRGCHAVFTTSRAGFSPEVFSRSGGEVWIGGLNSAAISLPGRATERRVDPGAIATVRREANLLLGLGEELDADDLEVVRESLCFRPVTPHGTPVVSRIDDGQLGGNITTRPGAEGGVFLAAGHGPWGISLSLGTGMVLAELAQGRRLSANLRSLALR